jgi:hypothetical protein
LIVCQKPPFVRDRPTYREYRSRAPSVFSPENIIPSHFRSDSSGVARGITGTMTRAAAQLGISQPAVSNIIAALEHEIGFSLFTRRAGRLEPTPEAHLFFKEVSRSLEAFESTERAAAEIKQGKHGRLTIAAYPSLSMNSDPAGKNTLAMTIARRP